MFSQTFQKRSVPAMLLLSIFFLISFASQAQPISGCTDSTACNYNADATADDGCCTFQMWYIPSEVEGVPMPAVLACSAPDGYILANQPCVEEVIDAFPYCSNEYFVAGCYYLYNNCLELPGCTDITACNYNQDATTDDGSCIFDEPFWYIPSAVCGGPAELTCSPPEGYILADQACAEEVITNNTFCQNNNFNSSCYDAYTICISDCPELGLNIGDDCNDGDPETAHDMIMPDCNCAGVLPPSNDDCANAILLALNPSGECPGNAVEGTTLGSNSEAEYSVTCNATTPDVFYSFNSGVFSEVTIEVNRITATDFLINVFEECDLESGGLTYCFFNPVTPVSLELAPETDYIIRIATDTVFARAGTFNICLEGIYECPGQSANIGDPCDDGLAYTENDSIAYGCVCSGEFIDDALFVVFNEQCAETCTVEFYEPGTTNLVTTISGTVSGNSFIAAGLSYGTYDVFVKLNEHLKKGFANFTLSAENPILTAGSFIPGDVNNDNKIGIQDFSIFSVAYGSSNGDANYNSSADLDCDNEIDLSDFSTFSVHFGTDGQEPPIF